jgi:hypothetical protein
MKKHLYLIENNSENIMTLNIDVIKAYKLHLKHFYMNI